METKLSGLPRIQMRCDRCKRSFEATMFSRSFSDGIEYICTKCGIQTYLSHYSAPYKYFLKKARNNSTAANYLTNCKCGGQFEPVGKRYSLYRCPHCKERLSEETVIQILGIDKSQWIGTQPFCSAVEVNGDLITYSNPGLETIGTTSDSIWNAEVDDPDFLELLNTPKLIDRFEDEYAFLSNFYKSPFTYEGREWPTVEHAFQAQKSLNEGEQELIRSAETPLKAKQMGRKQVILRPDWDDVKEDIMHEILSCKFHQNPDLARRLLLTGSAELVEGNTWHDNFWGDCTCSKCKNERGNNLSGKLLMKIRNDLQK